MFIKSIFNRLASFLYIKSKYRGKLVFSLSSYIDKTSVFEGANRIYPNTKFCGKLGYGSYVSSNSRVTADIGRFTCIGPNVLFNHGTHPYKYPFASVNPMFYSLVKQNGNTFANEQLINEYLPRIIIGNDCWICERVFVNGGIKIGDGAVVLPGAVVTSDVPAYSIVGGVPAKIIGYRYDEDTISFLQKTQWWNNSIEWFSKNWKLISNLDELKQFYAENHTK